MKPQSSHCASLPPAQDDGTTALHLAVEDGRINTVRELLAAGADPGLLDIHGNTPAEMAAQRGHTEVEQLLRNAQNT